MNGITRGDLAQRSGVNPETIRYYERHRLLPPPARTAAGYRQFTDDDVQRIRFIKRAQSVGFSLEEIRGLLEIRVDPAGKSGVVRDRVSEKVAAIDDKIRALQAVRDRLVALVAECPGGDTPASECPILECFAHDEYEQE